MPSNSRLEEKVLIVGIDDARKANALFLPKRPKFPEVRQSLEGVVLDDFDVVVISSTKNLDDAKALLFENYSTPVIYQSQNELSFSEKDRLLKKYNLFLVSSEKSLQDEYVLALDAKRVINEYKSLDNNANSFLSSRDPPKFIHALLIARDFEQKKSEMASLMSADVDARIRKFWEQVIVPGMIRYDVARTGMADVQYLELAEHVNKFIQVSDIRALEKLVHVFGKGKNTEGKVGFVDSPANKYVFKLFSGRRNISAKKLAETFAATSRYFEGSGFRMLKVLSPLNFEDHPSLCRNDSFVLMERADSSLDDLMWRLNEAYDVQPERRSGIDALRTAIVENVVSDCVYWQKTAPAVDCDSSFVLPNGDCASSLGEYLSKRISGLAQRLSSECSVKFTADEITLFEESIKVYQLIQSNGDVLKRGRDLKLDNLLMDLPIENMTVPQILDLFGCGSDEVSKSDVSDKVKARLINIDPKLYRKEHILEPIIRVLTSSELRFIYKGVSWDSLQEGKFRRINEVVSSRIADYLARHSSSAMVDEVSTNLLLTYRPLRDIDSLVGYWSRSKIGNNDGKLSDSELCERKRVISSEISHQITLERAFCTRLMKQYLSAAEFCCDMKVSDAKGYLDLIASSDEKCANFLKVRALNRFAKKLWKSYFFEGADSFLLE